MTLEMSWFLFVIFPFVLCTTLAALILWGVNLKATAARLSVYASVAGVTQTLSYYQIHLELIRFSLEIASGFLLAWIIFQRSWRWTAQIFFTSYLFGTLFYSIAAALIVILYQVPFTDLLTEVEASWLMITLPFNLLAVCTAWFIRRSWLPGLEFFYELKNKSREHPSLIVALGIQAVLFVGLVTQIYLNEDSTSLHAMALTYAGLILLCGLGMFVLLKYMKISRREIVITQDQAAENIVEMLQTVRGQRHDFLNHLQVIYGLNRLRDYAALEGYLEDLVDDVAKDEDLLRIDNPVIAALVHAKIAQARSMGIEIQPTIEASLAPVSHNALDIARILGNLIDNALDEVKENEAKWLGVNIFERGEYLHCSVTNPSRCNPDELKDIFAAGVSSKPDHSGLGLFIARKLAKKLQGRLEICLASNRDLTFTLVIPYPVVES